MHIGQVKDPQEYVPLITCLMDSEFPPDAAGECIADLGTESITVKEVEDCTNSDAGSALLYINGLRTKSLEPTLTFVPWLLYNDVISTSHSYSLIMIAPIVGLYPGISGWGARQPHQGNLLQLPGDWGQVPGIPGRLLISHHTTR